MDTVVLNTNRLTKFDDEEFFALCASNKDLRIERNSKGEIIIMSPVGSESDAKNSEIIAELVNWNRKTRLGRVFGPSAGFKLPNSAVRSPDASWIGGARWNALPAESREKFAPLCPDFIVELRSPSDNLTELKEKMQEWVDNGCRLGWLIDPETETSYIYRHSNSSFGDHPSEIQSFDASLSGEDVLKGFVLELKILRF